MKTVLLVLVAAAAALGQTEVTFPSGPVTLSGTLFLPPAGKHAGIVLTHGSGEGKRTELRRFAERFAQLGMGVLIYDKRSPWYDASLEDLGDDALAAAAFLKTQPNVDSSHVGVWGISQAGWLIPRVISRAPEAFSFAVIVTGGAVAPIEVERYDYAAALDRLGNVAPDDRRKALALVEQYFAYLKTGVDRAALEAGIAAAGEKPWYAALNLGRILPSAEGRKKWQWVADYDPEPDIAQVKVPILVILGGRDRPGLSESAYQKWRVNLAKAGNKDATITVLVDAGHGATTAGPHHPGGGPPVYANGYLEMVDAWLRAH